VAMTAWISALTAGWLLWAAAGATAAAPKAYVGLFKDDAVAVIDTAQNRVVGTIRVPKGPHGLVITPDGRKVYVSSDGASAVSVIDTGSDRVVATIDVGANPHGLAVSGDGRRVLALGWGTNRALVIDTASDRVITEVAVAQSHNGTLSRDGSIAWVGSQPQGGTALVRLDLTAGKEAARVPLDKAPRGLELTPDGKRLFFTLAGSDSIQVLDTASNQITAQIPVGASPHYAPFTPDGRIAYVTNEATNDVSVVDLAGRRVLATIPVGNAPRKIAVQPGTTAAAASPSAATAAAGRKSKAVTMNGVTYADHGTKDVRKLSKLELEADDYYFGPTFLRGNPGQKLTLMIENEVATLHNITIPALGIDKDIPPKGKVQLDVTFPASGVVTFSCKFHGPLGMAGALKTTE